MYRYFVSVRQWRNNVYGNTYMSVKVTDMVDGTVHIEPFTYGHGEAMAMSVASRLVGEDVRSDNARTDIVYVIRKRDLHKRFPS